MLHAAVPVVKDPDPVPELRVVLLYRLCDGLLVARVGLLELSEEEEGVSDGTPDLALLPGLVDREGAGGVLYDPVEVVWVSVAVEPGEADEGLQVERVLCERLLVAPQRPLVVPEAVLDRPDGRVALLRLVL